MLIVPPERQDQLKSALSPKVFVHPKIDWAGSQVAFYQPGGYNMGSTVILGGTGLIGSACVRHCRGRGLPFLAPSREECDAGRYGSVESFLCDARPERVIVAAGAVGGIVQNLKTPADFLFANSQFASATLPACQKAGVADVVFFGSSCMYPVDGTQPYKEEAILSGPPRRQACHTRSRSCWGAGLFCDECSVPYDTLRPGYSQLDLRAQ